MAGTISPCSPGPSTTHVVSFGTMPPSHTGGVRTVRRDQGRQDVVDGGFGQQQYGSCSSYEQGVLGIQ